RGCAHDGLPLHTPFPLRARRTTYDMTPASRGRRADQRVWPARSAQPSPSPGRMIMTRRTLLRLGAGSALAALATDVPALAQQKLALKATDVHPLGYPTVEAVVAMGRKLEAASGGRLSIQMYPSMQLGGEKEMIE